MGDVGSLGLGGALGTVAILIKQELLLVIVGGVFVLEALSVIVQVASFKLTGKRVFRMAPAAPPLRAHGLERAEGDHAFRDPRDHLRAAEPDDVEVEMKRCFRCCGWQVLKGAMGEFSVSGQRVVVVGAARSGVAAARLLVRRGAQVTISDVKPAIDAADDLRAQGVALELGGHTASTFGARTSSSSARACRSISLCSNDARSAGVPVIGELELASRWVKGRLIAITGTKGKSTTTRLTEQMLERSGFPVLAGGNIGVPLSAQVEASTPETLHVVEASSFQLEATDTFHPWIAALLNFSPDHLDQHPTVEAYAAAKQRIFARQTARRRRGDQRRGSAGACDGARRGRQARAVRAGSRGRRLHGRGRRDRRAPWEQTRRHRGGVGGARAGASHPERRRGGHGDRAVGRRRRRRHCRCGGGVRGPAARDGTGGDARRRAVRERLEGDQRRVGPTVDRKRRPRPGGGDGRPVQGRRVPRPDCAAGRHGRRRWSPSARPRRASWSRWAGRCASRRRAAWPRPCGARTRWRRRRAPWCSRRRVRASTCSATTRNAVRCLRRRCDGSSSNDEPHVSSEQSSVSGGDQELTAGNAGCPGLRGGCPDPTLTDDC